MIGSGIINVISTALDKLKRINVKSLFLGNVTNGRGDVREAVQAGPYGFDSNPIAGTRGLYTTTQKKGAYYTYAYLYQDSKAQPGESRMFSTDTEGAFKFNVWLTASGEMLMGDSDVKTAYTNFAVKFNELKTEFNLLKSSHNSLVSLYNSHIHPAIDSVTSAPVTVSPTASQATANSSNIDNAKNEKVKTN